MALHFAVGPKAGESLVQQGIGRLASRKNPIAGMAVDFTTARLQPPHAVYDLRADAVANGGELAAASATGFRYLIEADGNNVGAAEVLVDQAGAATVLANINFGPYVDSTARTLAALANTPAISAGSYEARVLRFSAISLMALWLKPDTGNADIVVPLDPAPPGLQAGQQYSAADFLKAIQPLAQKRAANKGPATVP